MKPSQLTDYTEFCLKNNFTLLVKGKPGIGKTDIMLEASKRAERNVILSHPVVSDPTDFKGLPFADEVQIIQHNGIAAGKKKVANFLPFGDLRQLLEAEQPTTWFIDDLGQAPVSVQAAIMQILLAREINGHKISDKVSIVAATNRKEDKAGVTGLLEPVKSRFRGGIIEMEVDHTDWCSWALSNNMPLELIAFIRFKPDILDKAVLSKDIVNTVSPRTIASVGMVQNAGIKQEWESEVFKGIAGEAFSAEYCAFLKLMRELPNLDTIIMNPTGAPIPKGAGVMYALTAGLAQRATPVNLEAIITYMDRVQDKEFAVTFIKDVTIRKPEVSNTQAYIKWSLENQKLLNL